MTNSKLTSSSKASSMAELMQGLGSSIQTLKKGDIVEGTIKKLTPKEILLDIGAKGDALVIEYDKKNLENLLTFLKVGDKVKASVISAESEEGFPVVSLRRMLDDIIFTRFEDLSKDSKTFSVSIFDSTRGGYFAQTSEGIKGFLPNSQVMQEENLVGRTIEVKIIEFDREKKRVIFSQKATMYTTDPQDIQKAVKRDDVVDATVTTVTPYCIYVAINLSKTNPIEGFIHISEISYDRVENLPSLYKKGDSVKAQVLDLDRENRRVNLSIKKLAKDSFDSIKDVYKIEQKVKGIIKDVKSRGITVELEKGISGFIPANKISSSSSYKVGDALEAEVTDIDSKRRQIVLSPILKSVPIGYR